MESVCSTQRGLGLRGRASVSPILSHCSAAWSSSWETLESRCSVTGVPSAVQIERWTTPWTTVGNTAISLLFLLGETLIDLRLPGLFSLYCPEIAAVADGRACAPIRPNDLCVDQKSKQPFGCAEFSSSGGVGRKAVVHMSQEDIHRAGPIGTLKGPSTHFKAISRPL